MYNINQLERPDIVQDYLDGMKWDDISSKYNVNIGLIHHVLKHYNIKPSRDFGWSEEKKNKLREMYLANATYKEMYEALDCKGGTLTYWVRKLGLPMRGSGRNNTYVNPFLENSPERDYWLGYIFADGHIENNDQKRQYSIQLFSKDFCVIDEFNRFTGNICKIYSNLYTKSNGEVCTMYRATILSKDLTKWFSKKYDISSTKHHNLNPPIDLNWDILRGYFDGDGWAGDIFKHQGWSITSCSINWINRVKEFLVSYNIPTCINTYKDCYKLCVWKKEYLYRLVPLLYKNNTFRLERKFKRLEPFMSNHD